MSRLPVVSTYDEVKANILQFHSDLQTYPQAQKKLSQHYHWYYVPELSQFAPSKFIGYKNIDYKRYKNGQGILTDARLNEY